MAVFNYGVGTFTTTTFTSPLIDTDDVINALDIANFTLTGNGGDDVIETDEGDDTVTTGAGNDVVTAGNGNNTVSAGAGSNVVTTGSGNDVVTTGAGRDVVNTGAGNDVVSTGAGIDIVHTGSGDDQITTAGGNDAIWAGAGTNTIDSGVGDDVVHSGGGSDSITTAAGADIIGAGRGNDNINAGTGDDTITAGGGIDAIIGGGGHDTFVYDSLGDAMLGADTISDFKTSDPSIVSAGDRLDFSRLVADFSALPDLTLAELVAQGYLSFSGTPTSTTISFDSNGDTEGGLSGTLVTLTGVAFSSESASVNAFGDNILLG
jgi:Ca2+-binding RTX toxin-like protein